jgi:hypothetical protein
MMRCRAALEGLDDILSNARRRMSAKIGSRQGITPARERMDETATRASVAAS